MIVPYEEISRDTLLSLIESFVLREGTDYGDREVEIEKKVADVVDQLKCGDAFIVFDPASESINIISRREAISMSLLNADGGVCEQ